MTSSGGELSFGFFIDMVNATFNPVEIVVEQGMRGVFVDQGVVKVNDPLSGGIYGMFLEFLVVFTSRATF